MNVVESVLNVFTLILEWFTTALSSVSSIFYAAETGLTFIGTVSVIGLGIGVILMVIAMIRGLLKGRG